MDWLGEIGGLLVAAAIYLAQYLWSKRKEADATEFEVDAEVLDDYELEATDEPEYHTAIVEPPDASMRQELIDRVDALAEDAARQARDGRVQRATAPLAETLETAVIAPARHVEEQLRRSEILATGVHAYLAELELIFAQIEVFMHQRRDPEMLAQVGDADALALACYRPMIDFARAENLPLTSATPVTQLGGYDMAIWTGFIPTGLAPIFLPPDFFERIAWWPAVAHEIGHDFLAATGDTEQQLRGELGLWSVAEGSPLAFNADGITMDHLWGLFSVWFEEIFCDVFGTLMLGPAYGIAMLELFAAEDDPSSAIRVTATNQGLGHRYDPHPPPHLRLMTCALLLGQLGQADDANALVDKWYARHPELEHAFYLPLRGRQWVAIDADPVLSMALDLVVRLYTEQFQALSGYRLADIPGVDFGPAANARAERAKADYLAGRTVGGTADPRALVAGAVLAAHAAPERHATILALARRSVRATGSLEHRPDVHDAPLDLPQPSDTGPLSTREAFILHTILAPPPSARRGGHGRTSTGLLSRVA